MKAFKFAMFIVCGITFVTGAMFSIVGKYDVGTYFVAVALFNMACVKYFEHD